MDGLKSTSQEVGRLSALGVQTPVDYLWPIVWQQFQCVNKEYLNVDKLERLERENGRDQVSEI